MSIQILQAIESETITERPICIPFSFDNKERLPKGKDPGDCIVIRPITVRTWFRIRPLLMRITQEDLNAITCKEGEIPEDGVKIIDKYGDLIIDIVCIGIHNKPTEPPLWFRDVLCDNTTWKDIYLLLNAILYRIGFYPFYRSITTLQSVSPMTRTEIIAAQKNIASWYRSAQDDSLCSQEKHSD